MASQGPGATGPSTVGARPGDAPTRGQVLVVDDDVPTARGFGRILTGAGFSVTLAHDGKEAAELASKRTFDTILSDIAMPGMSGIELMRAVREHDLDVPVILITGGPAIESAVEAMEYGALLYLIKPIEAQQLEDVVTRAVRLHQMALIKREALALFHIDNKALGDRAGLEARFENALATLWVAYQPIVSWSAQLVFAYEALVRNKEPTLRSPPDLFEAAERLGRLQELGRVIRDRVASTADELPSGGLLFVNVHALELDDDTLFQAESPLSRHAKSVVLEITERAPIEKIRDVGNRVAQLRALGYRIAVDDLGAGYAGLTSFAHLEPEVVKVDMSLIRGLDRSPLKQKLLSSIVALCQELGIQMIAEGIETEAERDMLITLGGDLCQGYLFARPQLPWANTAFGGVGRDPDSNHGL
ncbi:MAG TPA: EAL domain-containing protein [Polyangia bacterium]|jgi:EAL domain-containing protein (putative c-di-GMP-specific phosphodiesterase class I)|nr:EAL domain-containing protein [Polyangia bacterium]